MAEYQKLTDGDEIRQGSLVVAEARLRELGEIYMGMVKAGIEMTDRPFHRQRKGKMTAKFLTAKNLVGEYCGFYSLFCHCFPWVQRNYDDDRYRIHWSAIDISEIRDEITSVQSFLNFVLKSVHMEKGYYAGYTFTPCLETTTTDGGNVIYETSLIYTITKSF